MYQRKKSKINRRMSERIFPEKKLSETRLNQRPGVHGSSRQRRGGSEYGIQLLEKQKVKFTYGLREKQFRSYYENALNKSEPTPVAFLKQLESRLDNVVYRSGFTHTREMARQMINHGHIMVNGKKVTIPSVQMKVGDVISFNEKEANKKLLKTRKEAMKDAITPTWLTLEVSKVEAKVMSEPLFDDSNKNFDLSLVVQFYSR
jgi:small subunit ribosomal protein S4